MKLLSIVQAAVLLATVSVARPSIEVRDRDPTWPACDNSDGSVDHRRRVTSQPVKYVAAGDGACGHYTDDDFGVCVKPGWVHSGHRNHCGDSVVLRHHGNTIQARIIDVCGANSSPFGCDDLYLTRAAFIALGGDTLQGALDGNVVWSFT
ncbi:hypothetical protein V8E36_003118 [Tilletia maclaganii]